MQGLSPSARLRIEELSARYPRKRSALIPSLQIAQEEAGYISEEIMVEIARMMELSPNEVREVVSFYSLLHQKPVGRYVIQVCTNISCQLCDAEGILRHLRRRLGVGPGETTPDMKYTLLEVECLGSCGTSPVMQVNDEYHENLTPEKIDCILDGLP
ncbi:MAG: NADH-quinone oxidoreductase subunit NuoE [Acidobacteria bacterium]|jgi:NADH-quinone oxidoreductase subunit E|nr:NADH-quinone oxidoreductase subunit NuoE [Acidobacteriota bacterium]